MNPITYRYFLELAFDGTAYHGWQAQLHSTSIQERLTQCLEILLQQPISITGCGRTDAGVHASYYVAHFDSNKPLDTSHFLFRINKLLPTAISIYSCTLVDSDADARFSAIQRQYKYYIHTNKHPYLADYAWYTYGTLDMAAMNEACSCFIAQKDWSSFCKLKGENLPTTCTVSEAHWQANATGFVFTISANRFVRNMVRAAVGTLVEIGKGKIAPSQMQTILEGKNRTLAAGSAPAQGLFLYNIIYPASIFKPTGLAVVFDK